MRFLSGVVLVLLRLAFMPTLEGVEAQEGAAMLHRGAFSDHLTLVGSDGSQEQLAITDDDVLYLGITVDGGQCQPHTCARSVILVRASQRGHNRSSLLGSNCPHSLRMRSFSPGSKKKNITEPTLLTITARMRHHGDTQLMRLQSSTLFRSL